MHSHAYELLCEAFGSGNVRTDEPLSEHTSFKIGGPARLFVTPETVEDVQAVVRLCNNLGLELRVLGLGCNLLVSDDGVGGVVMCLAEKL